MRPSATGRGDVKKGRGRVAFLVALGFLFASALVGIAVAKKKVSIPMERVEITLDGGIKPKMLSRSEPTPIAFNISGEIKSTVSGEPHPPALEEFILESDKRIAIDVKGLRRCTAGPLDSSDSAGAEAGCQPAILGRGRLTVEILLSETPILTQSKAIVFNGGFKGGVTTLYIHAYLTVPVPAAIITTVKIKKIHKGRYGLLSVATIPKIAGGSGSVKNFDLTISKRGVLTAKCTDGQLQAHVEAVFADETVLATTLSRPCIPKG
jgi:hypothetical protein